MLFINSTLTNAADEELTRERMHVRAPTFEFNHTSPIDNEKRQEIIKQLITAKGLINIEAPFNCDYSYNIEVGENFLFIII